MKKNKLKLADFKVSSFVTLSKENNGKTVMGGFGSGDEIKASPRCGASAATICPDCPDW